MNKYCYRVIFSKTQQRFIVVSELAKVGGKAKTENTTSINSVSKTFEKMTALLGQGSYLFKPISFALCCALGFVSLIPQVQAENASLIIKADPTANVNERPHVIETANGIPQVNIQTPNPKGLSYNRYSQFDVNIQGSQIVAENDLAIQGKNITIKEAENRAYSEDFEQTRQSGLLTGGGKIGFTIGSRKETTESDKTKYYAKGSQVGSLQDNVNIIAENNYTQQASTVTSAKKDVNIKAKQVNIVAGDDKYETNRKHTFEQKGLTVALNIPAVQAIQGAQSAYKSIKQVGDSKNNRINAMMATNAAFDTFRTIDSVGEAAQATQALANGDMANANISVSIAYGEQKNTQQTSTKGSLANSSQVNAGGKANIIATGDKTSDINIVGSDVSGKQGTTLLADNDVNIKAKSQTHQERSSNKSQGWNAGVAVSYGQNGFSFGITAGGNYGKGYGNGDEQSWVASRVGDKNSQTTIVSKNNTSVIGSQVIGKGVDITAQNLNIESLQDTMTYKGKQKNMSGQVTVGYGVSGSASYSQSKVNADYASVNTQAGVFAGDDGFKVNVKKHTDLKGGLITSTEKAEQEGKNSFTTGTISSSDIQNHSSYSAKGFGLSGGVSVAGDYRIPLGGTKSAPSTNETETTQTTISETANDTKIVDVIKGIGGMEITQQAQNQSDVDKTNGQKVELNGVAGIFSQGNWGIAKGLATGLLGQVSDKDSDSSVTTSRINTKNIQIGQSENESIQATIATLNKENLHRTLAKTDVETVKSKVEGDLQIAQQFIDNLQDIGDKLHYKVEKNEKNIVLEFVPENCHKLEDNCVRAFELNMENIQVPKDKLEAEIRSRMYVHGILNTSDKDRTIGAIQYSGSSALDNVTMIVRKPYAGLAEEFAFTIFERVRAGLNMPSIFGASNASRDQVKNFEQLNEYNKRVGVEERVNLDHVVHSLGASSSQNSFNWAKSQGLTFDHLTFNGYGAGPSYPMQSNSLVNKLTLGRVEKSYVDSATELFGKGQVSYTAAPADVVATGIGLPWVAGRYGIGIGNSDSTSEKKWYIPVWDALSDHTRAYIRDERAAKFLFGDDSEDFKKLKTYHQEKWGGFEPKIKTIQFNNHKVEDQ